MVLERFVIVYLIYGNRVYLVDSGVAETKHRLFEYLEQTGRRPEELAVLVHTHAHPDHMGASAFVRERTGCDVAIHEAERKWLQDVEAQVMDRAVPGFHQLVGGPVQATRVFADGDVLDLEEGLALAVIHTPGHSPGHVAFYLAADRALLSGDAVPLAGDLPIYDDVEASLRSIRRLADVPDVDVLLAAWDDPRRGLEIQRVLEEGEGVIRRVDAVVAAALEAADTVDLLKTSREVLGALGLPGHLVNPLLARTIAGHVRARNLREAAREERTPERSPVHPPIQPATS